MLKLPTDLADSCLSGDEERSRDPAGRASGYVFSSGRVALRELKPPIDLADSSPNDLADSCLSGDEERSRDPAGDILW